MRTYKKRHFLAVTMPEDLYLQAKEAAADDELKVTSWVRKVVVAALEQQEPNQ